MAEVVGLVNPGPDGSGLVRVQKPVAPDGGQVPFEVEIVRRNQAVLERHSWPTGVTVDAGMGSNLPVLFPASFRFHQMRNVLLSPKDMPIGGIDADAVNIGPRQIFQNEMFCGSK